MYKAFVALVSVTLALGGVAATAFAEPPPKQHETLLWLNHLALVSGDPTVTTTSADSTSSGVGGGLTGLVIASSTLGDTDSFGGNKVVHMAVEVPPGWTLTGVRVCYEDSAAQSFIKQIRLAQVQDPPATALVFLDDATTDLTPRGPVCVNSLATSIDPAKGAVLLSLRIQTGDTRDKIVIRGLGLRLHENDD